MTDIYLTKAFQTFAGDERISDATIVKVAREMQNQLYAPISVVAFTKNASPGWGVENGAGIGY
ncbi:TPA: hypothetical protein ACIJX4_002799 [Serratia marcescens]